jgi:hypothetical protein
MVSPTISSGGGCAPSSSGGSRFWSRLMLGITIGRSELPRNSLYFVNWWFDAMIIGGVSILVWAGLSIFDRGINIETIFYFAIIASIFINFPHFSATVYRLYQSSANVRQFPVTAFVLPLVILGAVIGSLWQPEVIAPSFLLIYFLWSPYHYCGQTVGLTLIYAKRSGFIIGPRERLALSGFIFSAFVYGFTRAAPTGANFYGMTLPTLAVPDWVSGAALAATCAGTLFFASVVISWCIAQKRLLPPIVLVPAAAHLVWFVAAANVKVFLALVPLFHSLQYLLIAAVMQLQLRIGGRGGEHSWRSIKIEVFRWGLRNILGGAILFIGLPVLLSWLPIPFLTIAGVIAVAVNIHHFFVDGVIWKLRDPATSAALMMNIRELGGAAFVGQTDTEIVGASSAHSP